MGLRNGQVLSSSQCCGTVRGRSVNSDVAGVGFADISIHCRQVRSIAGLTLWQPKGLGYTDNPTLKQGFFRAANAGS
jgi:hypothetical protein